MSKKKRKPKPNAKPASTLAGLADDHGSATVDDEHADTDHDELVELLMHAWGVIANAYGGDWSKASIEWQTAAGDFRDELFQVVGEPAAHPGEPPSGVIDAVFADDPEESTPVDDPHAARAQYGI